MEQVSFESAQSKGVTDGESGKNERNVGCWTKMLPVRNARNELLTYS